MTPTERVVELSRIIYTLSQWNLLDNITVPSIELAGCLIVHPNRIRVLRARQGPITNRRPRASETD